MVRLCNVINPKRTGVGGYSKPEVNFPSNHTFQTLSIQGNEKRVMGGNENRVLLYTYTGFYKFIQWANTTNIGGLIIQGLVMNSQKHNNNSENNVIIALPHLRVKT